MTTKKTQIALICGALVLLVLLFIAPKTITASHSGHDEDGHDHSATETNVSMDATVDVYLNTASKNLEPAKKTELDKLVLNKKQDSLVAFWDQLKRPDLASYYAEENAKTLNTAEAWFKAGNRYYYSVQFTRDKTEAPVLYQCAMRCFTKGLTLDPKNTDARIMLAACYVEGTQDPMEGISRLREIERTDSNNVKLQLTFAFFSVKSQQYDRAIKRFNKVLSIDSTYIEAYLHLADAYEQQSDYKNTVAALEKYAAKTNDPTARLEIDKYIQQLKK